MEHFSAPPCVVLVGKKKKNKVAALATGAGAYLAFFLRFRCPIKQAEKRERRPLMRRAAAGVLTAGLSVEHTWQSFASAVCFLTPSACSHSSRSPPLLLTSAACLRLGRHPTGQPAALGPACAPAPTCRSSGPSRGTCADPQVKLWQHNNSNNLKSLSAQHCCLQLWGMCSFNTHFPLKCMGLFWFVLILSFKIAHWTNSFLMKFT